MSDKNEISQDDVVIESGPNDNKTFRARIFYKSGAVQELSMVAISTNIYEVMRASFVEYLKDNKNGPQFITMSGTGGAFTTTVVWSEVTSFTNWSEPLPQ